MNKVIQRALEIVGSQKRLADICGVSQPAVHKWLNGIDDPQLTGINSIQVPTTPSTQASKASYPG